MEAVHHFTQRNPHETEDSVAKFVENELGRHDWAANWSTYKVKYPNYLERIKGFFHGLGEDVDANEIARQIETMIVARPGRWR